MLDDFYGTQDPDQANAVAIQPDGKIVVAGASGTAHVEPIAMVARYNANGGRDLSFGPPPHGLLIQQVCFSSSCGRAEADAVTVMPNGEIVVAGVAVNNAAFFVMRLTPSGALDSSFAGAGGNPGGIDAFQLGGVNTGYHVGGVAVQADGNIVVDGTFGSTARGFAARVVSAGGSLDAGWNSGVGYTTEFSGSSLTALALQPSDGKAVAVGTDNSVSPARLLIARFTTAGAGDSTFNGGLGYNVARIGSGPDTGAALLATGDGRLIVAGTDQAGSSAGIGLFQFLQSTGTLDTGFAGGAGEVRVALPGGDAGTANALTLDGAGRIVVAGLDTTSQHLLVSRLSAAGALDGSFGFGGFSIPSIGTSAGAQGVAIDAAGDPVVAGFGTPLGAPDTDALTARLLGTTPPPSGGGGPPPPVVPTLSKVSQSHGTWREGNARARLTVKPPRHRHKHRAPVGTVFSFSLNEPATVSFTFVEQQPGRKVHRKCVVPTRRNRRKPACQRTSPQGSLHLSGHAGRNTVSFDGVLGATRKLPMGSYQVTVIATASGLSGRSTTLTFKIVR